MKALWEAPPSFDAAGRTRSSQRAPSFSPTGRSWPPAVTSPAELLWNESGGAPSRSGQRDQPAWLQRGRLVGRRPPRHRAVLRPRDEVHVWSAEGKRLRTIEFGAPTWWQVGQGPRVRAQPDRRHAGESSAASAILAAPGWRAEQSSVGSSRATSRTFRSERASAGWDGLGSRPRERALRASAAPGRRRRGSTRRSSRRGHRRHHVAAGRSGIASFPTTSPAKPASGRCAPGRARARARDSRPATAPPAAAVTEDARWVLGNAWADKKVRRGISKPCPVAGR